MLLEAGLMLKCKMRVLQQQCKYSNPLVMPSTSIVRELEIVMAKGLNNLWDEATRFSKNHTSFQCRPTKLGSFKLNGSYARDFFSSSESPIYGVNCEGNLVAESS
ncbi:hypothetical protein FRX31_013220 [Thalictrum thalictroides]|uniref:Uncharacterized protein n=1 Tax=Thalictrum thalictroides TaxID=46969 RepID=A0A7J6WL81_THATH|nr:hypothetical protein FRX31_013220 [Thalictrum thalictroides]